MFPQAGAGSQPSASPCWEIKTVAESHTHIRSVDGEVYDLEAVQSKGYINQLRPLDESK